MPLAPRTRICLACRTVLAEGDECPGGRGHGSIALTTPGGRKRLDDEVWGPDSRARALRQAAKAGAGGGGLGLGLEGCTGCELGEVAGLGELVAAVVVFVVVAVAAVLVVWVVKKIIELVREWRDKPKPHGALLGAPKPRGRITGRGVVLPGPPIELPWTAGAASAYAFELHAKSVLGGLAMLRDAVTAGFDVQLDDGRVVRVPAGRIAVRGKLQKEPVTEERLERYLREVDPSRATESRDLFPHDFARALVVRPGDRVDVLGELEPLADASGSSGYRANAGVLAPVGVPKIVVRSAGGVRVDPGPGDAGEGGDAEEEESPASEAGGARLGQG